MPLRPTSPSRSGHPGEAVLTAEKFGATGKATSSARVAVRRLLWVYFWLLIFEGALRKWVFPQWAGALLVVRDPVALLIYWMAHQGGLIPSGRFMRTLLGLIGASALLMMLQLLLLDVPFTVLAYGFRTFFLHLPLILIIPLALEAEDLQRFGHWLMALSVPMALLMGWQFEAAPEAWINRTPGLGGGKQLMAVLGKIRPAGTFSFSTGPVSFFALTAAFMLHRLKKDNTTFSRLLVISASLAITLAIAVSGSRSLVISVAIVSVAWVVATFAARQAGSGLVRVFLLVLVTATVLAQIELFREGAEVLTTRWDMAAASERAEGGLLGRVFRSLTSPLNVISSIPLIGCGLGVGTNVGATLLTGKAQFLLSEEEWGRVVLELGPILGCAFILWRVSLAFWMARICLQCAAARSILPLLLFSACAVHIVSGQIAQPTTLGFTVFVGGLCLAAVRAASLNISVDIVAKAPGRLPLRFIRPRGPRPIAGTG